MIVPRPVAGEDVVVYVTVTGECRHVQTGGKEEIIVEKPNCLQLCGTERAAVATLMYTTGVNGSVLHYQKLANMSPVKVGPSNMTACQAHYEQRKIIMHGNIVTELELQRDVWQTLLSASKVSRFIEIEIETSFLLHGGPVAGFHCTVQVS
jgi:hypothetical protein